MIGHRAPPHGEPPKFVGIGKNREAIRFNRTRKREDFSLEIFCSGLSLE